LIALGILLRALQGAASASINSTCFSLAANKYAHEVTFVVGVLEATSGIGLVIGLLGGSIINERIGYKAVFILFGSLLPILSVIVRVLFYYIERQQNKQSLAIFG
jgi:MFS family permease